MKASENGHSPVAELLIGATADVNAKDVSIIRSLWPVLMSFATYFLADTVNSC